MMELMNSGLGLLFYLAVFAVMIGVLVTAHEYGHFIAARFFGVRVLRFAIAFGPAILSWKDRHNTEYRIGTLPFGGYVLMQNGDEPEARQYPGQSYRDASLFARLVICFAGPLANLLLAILLQTLLIGYGIPDARPLIGQVEPGSAAQRAGIQPGDSIQRIGDYRIHALTDIRLALVGEAGGTGVPVSVLRPDITETVLDLQLDLSALERMEGRDDPMQVIGLVSRLAVTPLIGQVVASSAADKAGLMPGDLLLEVDEKPVQTWMQWVEWVRQSPDKSMDILVRRDGEELSLRMVPEPVSEAGETIGRAGVGRGIDSSLQIVRQVPLWQAPIQATERVMDLTVLTILAVGRLVTGKLSVENLTGPVGIAQLSGQAAQVSLVAFFSLMALLSISLGVINLVPLPVLDGGRAMLHLIEAAIRKPLSPRVEGVLNLVGVVLIVSLMMFTLVQDIGRL